MMFLFIAQAATVAAETPATGTEPDVVETIIEGATAAVALLPMPWSAVAAGVLGTVGILWGWRKSRKNKKSDGNQ